MRPVLITDLIAAARVVAAVPDEDRPGMARHLFLEAEMADRYRLRTGRSHPLCGNGSVMSAAARHPNPGATSALNRDFLRALQALIGVALEERPDGTGRFPFVSGRGTLYHQASSSRGVRSHGGSPSEGIVDRSGVAADL